MEIANNASNSNVVMTSSWHQAMSEAKRQYEAIDGALEVKTLMEVKSTIFSHVNLSFRFHRFVDIAQYSEHRQGLSGVGKDAARP